MLQRQLYLPEREKKHCAGCHMLEQPRPEQIHLPLSAPAFDAVIFHLKDAIRREDTQEKFIVDYVINPDASKSVCESNKVAKFGVIPSLKGKVTEDDLKEIAGYLLEKYPHTAFVRMIKEILENDEMAALKRSPFLVNSDSLPHMTKTAYTKLGQGKTGADTCTKREAYAYTQRDNRCCSEDQAAVAAA